jgi:hypothetical protein
MEIDIHLKGRWHRCAELNLSSPIATSRRGGVTLRYDDAYAIEHLYRADYRALSVNLPVDLQWRAAAGRHFSSTCCRKVPRADGSNGYRASR